MSPYPDGEVDVVVVDSGDERRSIAPDELVVVARVVAAGLQRSMSQRAAVQADVNCANGVEGDRDRRGGGEDRECQWMSEEPNALWV
jgi:hypothetical protein